jgi:hypothetical protein
MSDLNGKQLITLAVVLKDQLNTGDWQELFTVTNSEYFLELHSSFMRDVHWKNDSLKQGCINAVKYVLERNGSNLNEIWNLDSVKAALKRKEPELYDVIEAIVCGGVVVATPEVANINDTVFKALEDAEVLLTTQGAANAYDRAHTALHGFLKQVCKNKGITHMDSDAITALLPKVNDYIKLQPDIGRNDQVFNMLRSAGSMLNTINYLRNHHSLSHANKELLTEPDAKFAINLTRSIMSYIDDLVG